VSAPAPAPRARPRPARAASCAPSLTSGATVTEVCVCVCVTQGHPVLSHHASGTRARAELMSRGDVCVQRAPASATRV